MVRLDPDATGGGIQQMEERRADGMTHLARRVLEQGPLREEITPAAAVDLLGVITSFDAFDPPLAGRKLSSDEVADRLVEMARAGTGDPGSAPQASTT